MTLTLAWPCLRMAYRAPLLFVSRYCVVLLTAEANKLSKPFEAFLSFALANTQDTVRFVHVYSNRQQEFASTLLPDMEAFQGKSGVSHGPLPIPIRPVLGVQSPDFWKLRRPRWNPIQTSSILHLPKALFLHPGPSQLSPLGHFP